VKREAQKHQFGGFIMASVAQIQANRSNAQKSTGPRTAEGKERASRNALKHGLLAREVVIQGEDPAEFELFREGMLEELAPAGTVETMLAQRVVSLSWRLRRAERLQTTAFVALDDGEPTPLLDARHKEWKQIKGNEWERGLAGLFDEDAALGKVVVEDFGGARVLDRLLMYERRIESSLYRTMAQLRQERQARTTAAGLEEAPRSENCPPAGQEAAARAELASFGAEIVAEGGAGSGGGCEARFVPRLRGGVSSGGCVGRVPAPRSTPVATETSLATATMSPSAAMEGVSPAEGGLPASQETVKPAKLGSFGADVVPEEVAGGEESGGGCEARFVSRLREGVSPGGCVGRAPAPRPTPVATETSLATPTVSVPAPPEGVSRSEDGLAAGQEPMPGAELGSFGANVTPGFQPMNHRQDADLTKLHGQDAGTPGETVCASL